MKIFYFAICLMACTALNAQSWLRYDADVLPAETGGEPFDLTSLSQDSPGGDFEEMIVADPDITGNNLLRYIQPNGTKMYRFYFRDTSGNDIENTNFTLVTRLKGVDDWEALGLDRVFDLQLRNGAAGVRDELRLGYATNRIELDRAEVEVDSLVDLTDWNIFRMTAEGDLFTVYLNEDPTPVLQMVSSNSTGDRYLKIGDGSSDAVGGMVDWVALDTTGAYNPEESPLDETFTGVGGGDDGPWLRYEADVLPEDTGGEPFDLTSLSQDSPGGDFEEVIVADPDIAGNNLLRYIQPNGTKMYRFYFRDTSGNDIDNVNFTLVSRVKGVDDWETLGLDRVFDFQLRNGAAGVRDELRLGYATNRIELDRAEVEVDSLVDLTDWNIFRMTAQGDLYSVYLNEDPTPVLQMVSGNSTGDRYLKIGDGSSDAVGGLVDWVAFDTSGAYAPTDQPLDNSFTGWPIDSSSAVTYVQVEEFEMQLAPNPFIGRVNLTFDLDRASDVEAWITDMSGQIVGQALKNELPSGHHKIELKTDALPAGGYLIQLRVDDRIATRRLIKLD